MLTPSNTPDSPVNQTIKKIESSLLDNQIIGLGKVLEELNKLILEEKDPQTQLVYQSAHQSLRERFYAKVNIEKTNCPKRDTPKSSRSSQMSQTFFANQSPTTTEINFANPNPDADAEKFVECHK